MRKPTNNKTSDPIQCYTRIPQYDAQIFLGFTMFFQIFQKFGNKNLD